MPGRRRKPDKRAFKCPDWCVMIVFVIIILALLLLCLYAYLFMGKPSAAPGPDISLPPAGQSLRCRDETGRPVDWYIVYKLPEQKAKQSILRSGVAYAFITSNHKVEQWTLSKKKITDKSCILAQTLNQIEPGSNSTSVLMYNDAPPPGFGT